MGGERKEKLMGERIGYTFCESPWGELTLATSARGVCLVSFGGSLERARESADRAWGRA